MFLPLKWKNKLLAFCANSFETFSLLADGHTCSLTLGNPHHISGKRTFFKRQIWRFVHKIGFEKISFFYSHYPFCTSQNWNWFWLSKYVFFVSFCNVFFWQKTLKKVKDVFHSKFNTPRYRKRCFLKVLPCMQSL